MFSITVKVSPFSLLKQRDRALCWLGSISRTPADCLHDNRLFILFKLLNYKMVSNACLPHWSGKI